MSHPPASDITLDPLLGQSLAERYAIERIIGRGGVGLVYLAHDRLEAREVVVKVLAPQWAADPEALARFEREAARLGGLRHPNIVQMYDFGRDRRAAYLVMEYLRGELLSSFVDRQGGLALEVFVPIAAQILKGVGHAHARGLMVRDIKPANVMLCEHQGRANFVKLLDFGLAKLIKGDTPITEEHVMGTVGYLSPEQIKGGRLDLRVDVYALGVMFYYMLAGRLPFEGEDNAAVFYKTVNEPPPDLRALAPGGGEHLPPALVELVHDCLRKRADNRPRDADAIVERLIDAVPASLFRLPKAETATTAATAPAEPSGVPAAAPDAAIEVTHPLPTAETAPSLPGVSDVDTGAHERPTPTPARRWLRFAAAGAAAIVAVAVWRLAGPPSEPRAAGPTDAVVTEPGPRPDPPPRSAAADPPPTEPETPPAAGEARAAHAEPAPARLGQVEIASRPLANVAIDGAIVGTTPYAAELPVGPHTIRLTARGHQPWNGTLEVEAGETAPLAVTLVARRAAPASQRSAANEPPAPVPEDSATPRKASPFLPTKRNDGSAVFLPTKDPD